MEFDKTSLPSLIWFLHMPRDKIAMIPYSFVTDTKCIASYPLITNFSKVVFWPISSYRSKTVLSKTVVAGHVHWCITPCSSGVKRCSWSLWKADISLFNFGVHGWYWFSLDHKEKCLYFLVFPLILHRQIFSKCWNANLNFLDFDHFIT